MKLPKSKSLSLKQASVDFRVLLNRKAAKIITKIDEALFQRQTLNAQTKRLL